MDFSLCTQMLCLRPHRPLPPHQGRARFYLHFETRHFLETRGKQAFLKRRWEAGEARSRNVWQNLILIQGALSQALCRWEQQTWGQDAFLPSSKASWTTQAVGGEPVQAIVAKAVFVEKKIGLPWGTAELSIHTPSMGFCVGVPGPVFFGS